jgi:hypothetical protein
MFRGYAAAAYYGGGARSARMLIAETAVNAAPWWGVPVVAGAFTIIGVLAAQWTAWVLDRKRGHREDAKRWHSDRRATYATYVAAMDKVFVAASRYLYRNEAGEADRAAQARWEALEAARAANIQRQEVHLLASKAVRAATDALWDLPGQALKSPDDRTGGEVTSESFPSLYREHVGKLLATMRNELGIDR